MRILLLSAYDADSHKYWRQGLQKYLPNHHWTVLTLPPRHFSWRIRGNSLSWAFQEQESLQQDYDLLVASSMVDLSALRGFVPKLCFIPTLVYFHENQFAFPQNASQHVSVEPQIVNLYSALCADRLCFNSAFNRDTFLQGASNLLKRLPDEVPEGLIERLQAKAQVLPVPLFPNSDGLVPHGELEPQWRDSHWQLSDSVEPTLRIVWNARHEYDKGPKQLLALVQALEARGVAFKIAVLGQQFRRSPEEFSTLKNEFSHRLAWFGYLNSATEYRQCLASAHCVLSTALHEFQGLAVLEAIAEGCIPVLPNRLAYPEYVGSQYLYESRDNEQEEANLAVELLLQVRNLPLPRVSNYSWRALKISYEKAFQLTLNTSPRAKP